MHIVVRSLRMVLPTFVAFMVVLAQSASAVIIASDEADNAPYNDGWQTGDNGGAGFGAWTLTQTSGNIDGFNGQFIGTSANNGDGTTSPNIDTSGKAFGEYGNTGNSAVAYRAFGAREMYNSSTFHWAMDNGFIDNGTSVGLTLRNGNANANPGNYNTGARFEFLFLGGNSDYEYIDSTGVHDSGIAFRSTGLQLSLQLQGANGYSLIVSNGDNTALLGTYSGTLEGTANSSIDSFAIFNNNAGLGGAHDAFFNSFSVNAVPEPAVVVLFAVGGGIIWMRRRKTLPT
jgi:hypothetical protein